MDSVALAVDRIGHGAAVCLQHRLAGRQIAHNPASALPLQIGRAKRWPCPFDQAKPLKGSETARIGTAGKREQFRNVPVIFGGIGSAQSGDVIRAARIGMEAQPNLARPFLG
ncbi:MAG: hypothetical protein V4521_02170 [Pseudomonadota bacterium]